MALVARDDTEYILRLSADELSVMLACLREAWEALDVGDFRVRTGFESNSAVELRKSLRTQLRDLE